MGVDLRRTWRSRLDPNERYGLRLTLVVIAVSVVAIPFAYLTFNVVGGGPLTRFDARVADSLNAWSHHRQGVLAVLEFVSDLGKPVTLWVVGGVVAVLLWRAGRIRIAVFVVVTSLGGGLIDTMVKVAVNRPRPVVDHPVATAFGKSFPSGHTMGATVVYGALLIAFWAVLPQRWRVGALVATVVLVLAVASSRLLLGVHFVSDVVGSLLLGLAWLSGSAAVFQTWRHDLAVEKAKARADARACRESGTNDAPVSAEEGCDERLV